MEEEGEDERAVSDIEVVVEDEVRRKGSEGE